MTKFLASIFFIIIIVLSLTVFLFNNANAAVSATPKFIFLDPSRRSVAVTITNNGGEEDELWIEAKYGYVASDDTGGLRVIMDSSSDAGQQSAAGWIRAYPQRFTLAPYEAQVVRLVVSPPAGAREGEYWSRIMVSSKPRKPAVGVHGKSFSTGMVLISQVGLAFHYRIGSMSTGLLMDDWKPASSDSTLDITMKLSRTGNAAFWGSRTLRLINESGKIVYSSKKDLVVYKTMTFRERINRRNVPPGNYIVEMEFITGGRRDIELSSLIQGKPLRVSNSVFVK